MTTNKKIQIKYKSGDAYEELYPKTKADIVDLADGVNVETKLNQIDGELDNKVDKVVGKQLSTEDFTTEEKTKLANISPDAEKYVHPTGDGNLHVPATGATNNNKVLKAGASAGTIIWGNLTWGEVTGKPTSFTPATHTHPATEITESSTKRFVTDTNISTWNNKQNNLGYVPEDVSKKGVASGYASLDGNAKIPLTQLPDISKQQTYIVLNAVARNAIPNLISGDRSFETSTGNSYIWDGSKWLLQADANWENVNLDWLNIVNKPTSTIQQIDTAVTKTHDHINKAVIDRIVASGAEPSFDLSKFATKDELGNAGYGDMTKSIYDTNNNGKVDKAEVADSVAWTGVTGKPTTFTPTSHTHNASDINAGVLDLAHLPSASTTAKGVVQLISSTNSTSNTLAATASAVKAVNDLASTKTKIVVSTTQPEDADIWYEIL